MNVYHDKKNRKLDVRVEEIETVSGPWGEVETARVLVVMPFQGIFLNQGNIRVWFTNDDRRIPVRMKAKVIIGSIVADLVSGLASTANRIRPDPMRRTQPFVAHPVQNSYTCLHYGTVSSYFKQIYHPEAGGPPGSHRGIFQSSGTRSAWLGNSLRRISDVQGSSISWERPARSMCRERQSRSWMRLRTRPF